VSSVSDDTINVTIPATAVTSSKYRIRIQSSSPAQTSIFNSDEFTIFALPKPVINGQSSLCESTPNTYTVKPDSGSTVAWTVVSGGITFGSATTKDSVTVTSTSTGPAVLKCTETTVKGCTKDTTFAIAVNPVPIPVITSPTAVCTKNTMTFSVSQSANSTYQWKVKSGTIQSGGNSPSVNVVFVTSGTDSVTVVVTDTSTKCLGTASVQIAVYDVPTPAIVGQNTVCSNQTGIQYVTLQSNGTTYAWSISSGNASITGSSSSNSVSLAFGAAGTVKLVVQETNIAGCSSTDTITIQVNSSLSPQVQSSTGQFTFCAGSGITLDAGISGGAYQWYRDSTAVTGGTQQTLGVTTAGSYSVEVRKDGCQGFSTPVNVIVQQKSDVTILQNGTTLTVQGTGAYQWLDATKNPIVGASQQSYSPTIPAIYYAVITNGVCTDTSTAFAFSANPPGQVSLGICDFGIVPVSSIINNNGGHRKSIMVWNKTSSSVLLNSISIKNSGSPFG
ncbi:MAG: hypothetical protein JNL32_16145, partial [Candidatus Kapabacteria bacterium]|nr:hypothetical protein [Candidatus Kapabacteria bacterium]